jgi:hypothetical protein
MAPMSESMFRTEFLSGTRQPFSEPVFRTQPDAAFLLRLPARLADDFEWWPLTVLLNNVDETVIHWWRSVDGTSESGSVSCADRTYTAPPACTGGQRGVLCLTGQTGSWGLCLDLDSGVAVLGLARGAARNQAVIYQNNWMSRADAALAANVDAQALAWVEMPASYFVEGATENPLWHKWCFVCHVEDENDKLFYWPQLERFYDCLTPAMAGWRFQKMLPSQGFWRRVGPVAALRVTGSNAPVGGWQQFTQANCERVATKFLTENEHLRLRFDGRSDEAFALYPRERPGVIDVSFFWLRAARGQRRSPEHAAELYFVLPHGGATRADACNQYFEFFVRSDVMDGSSAASIVDQLAAIGRAIEVYETERPERFWELGPGGIGRISTVYGASSDGTNSSGLPHFERGTWHLRKGR